MRIGFGYDIHRLVEGRKLMIGGILIPHDRGEDAHSDGDVLIHSIIDAMFGAAGTGDIGYHFPPGEEAWKDAPGANLLERAVGIISGLGYRCRQVDSTIILERPKLQPHIPEIRGVLSGILGIPEGDVAVKARTREGLGDVGEGKAVEAYAVVLLEET